MLVSAAEVNDELFWAELPSALRTDMALEMARPLFQHSEIFKALDISAERLVAARLQPMVIPAGHNVAQEGDDADALYLMQEGQHLDGSHWTSSNAFLALCNVWQLKICISNEESAFSFRPD